MMTGSAMSGNVLGWGIWMVLVDSLGPFLPAPPLQGRQHALWATRLEGEVSFKDAIYGHTRAIDDASSLNN